MNDFYLIQGATLASTGERLELLVRDGVIVERGISLEVPEGAELITAEGLLLLPGLCDLHVHLGGADRLSSLGEAALAGGVTQFLLQADAGHGVDQVTVLNGLKEQAASLLGTHLHIAASITKGLQGKEMTDLWRLNQQGVRFVGDAGKALENPAVLRRAMLYAGELDLVFLSHPDTPSLSAGACVHEGVMAYRLGLSGAPACAEEIAVARDIALAESAQARLHLQTLSTSSALATLRHAKQRGLAVTAEVSLHHLIFDESAIGDFETNHKLEIPLRPADEVQALRAAVEEGLIDCIVSDHRAQSRFSKKQDFSSASVGCLGLELSLSAAYDRLIEPGYLSWKAFLRSASERPRALLGLPPIEFAVGENAELVLFDPRGEFAVCAESLCTPAENTPFFGQRLKGRVEYVLV